jgi:hypothetical protein
VCDIRWLEDWQKDTGFAIRQMRKAPAFTAAGVISLALGIGANTAIFTLIESSLWRPKGAGAADLTTSSNKKAPDRDTSTRIQH